jgi:hypothetical protein
VTDSESPDPSGYYKQKADLYLRISDGGEFVRVL